MAPAERHCQATTADGSPCAAPSNLVDPETGLCASHDPARRERIREAGRKGARAAARSRNGPAALTSEELPELHDHQDAEQRLDLVSRAVLTGRVEPKVAHAAVRAVETWLKAHEGRMVAEDVEAVRSRLEDLEAELSGRPKLTREK